MNKPRPTEQDFQKFYYDKVATGEGCGCAERIIDVHEFNRLAVTPKLALPKFNLTRFLQKAGIYNRR